MNQEAARAVLIEHSKSKTNGAFPANTNVHGKLTNPVCGDHVELRLLVENETIHAIGHKASGCAICSASASILCKHIEGAPIADAVKLSEIFEEVVQEPNDRLWPQELAALACFQHLRVNPSRRMCALLPWVALRSSLKSQIGNRA